MINFDFLKQQASVYGFNITDKIASGLDKYAEILVEWNEKMNLTGITEPEDITIKHFVDSLLLLKHINNNVSMIDVGTGAGFPSLPCKIYDDSINLTMLDSLNKRVNFLEEVINQVGIKNATAVHGRAEECGADENYREKFDVATARAVAHMRELTELCLPFVKVGGLFVALKGYDIDTELDEAKPAIKAMGGKVIDVCKYELAKEYGRGIVIIKKISQTPTKYPRSFAKIKKSPIK